MKNNLQKTTIGHSVPDIFILQSRILVYKGQLAILRHAKTARQNSSENFCMQSVCETSLRQREAVLVKEESPSVLWPDLQLFPGPHKQREEHSERAGQRSDEMRGMSECFFLPAHLNGSLSISRPFSLLVKEWLPHDEGAIPRCVKPILNLRRPSLSSSPGSHKLPWSLTHQRGASCPFGYIFLRHFQTPHFEVITVSKTTWLLDW